MDYAFFLTYYSILRSFTYYSFHPAHYSLIILTTLIISMSERYIIQNSTINYTVIDITASRFTRDALINAHDAYTLL